MRGGEVVHLAGQVIIPAVKQRPGVRVRLARFFLSGLLSQVTPTRCYQACIIVSRPVSFPFPPMLCTSPLAIPLRIGQQARDKDRILVRDAIIFRKTNPRLHHPTPTHHQYFDLEPRIPPVGVKAQLEREGDCAPRRRSGKFQGQVP